MQTASANFPPLMIDLKEIPIVDCLDKTFRADLGIFFVRWKKKVSSEQLRAGYTYCLSEAIQPENRYWFFDLRKRGPVQPEDEQWIFTHFFPEVERQVPGTQYFAYLVSPTHQHFLNRNIGLLSRENISERTQIQIFNSESHALAWLNKMRLAELAQG